MTKAKANDFWHSRIGNVVQTVVALGLMYALASRGIDTGSLIQYFLTLVLLGIAINRFIKAVKG